MKDKTNTKSCKRLLKESTKRRDDLERAKRNGLDIPPQRRASFGDEAMPILLDDADFSPISACPIGDSFTKKKQVVDSQAEFHAINALNAKKKVVKDSVAL